MDFKNKQGSVDAHNVNLNFKQDNQDSHNIILNFEHLSDGSTNLNFGDDNLGQVDAIVNFAFTAEIEAQYTDSTTNIGTIDAVIDLGFTSQIEAVFSNNTIDCVVQVGFDCDIQAVYVEYAQVDAVIDCAFFADIQAQYIENLCEVDAVVDLSCIADIQTVFDLNVDSGLYLRLSASYQTTKPTEIDVTASCAQASTRSIQFDITYDESLTLSNYANVRYENANILQRAVQSVFEQATGLNRDFDVLWQENERIFISRSTVFEEAEKLRIQKYVTWQEMIRIRKQITYSYDVAEVFEKQFTLPWDSGLDIRIKSDLPWEKARPIYYRKHPVEPWLPPEPEPYVGSTDLNFICLCHEVDSHNVILNFGATDCIPTLANKNWWHIVNEITVTRLDNGQEIQVLSGNYRTDRSSWCWSYSLTIPHFELSKLDPIDNQPVILKIVVNGYEHLMLLENRTRSRQFAQETYTLSGRSVSALLDAPSSATRAFLQENERTSVQLAQAEIDRSSYPDLVLNWQLIDTLGWIVPTESFSYSGLTPIKAIQEIASAGGGFVYSEADSQAITIKPLYKKTFWNALDVNDYDILLPESIVLEQSTDYEVYPDYNGVTLTNDKTGLTAQVKRTSTSGNVLCETVNNALFTDQNVMGAYGKAQLAKAGLVENHTFNLPLTNEVGQCKPSDILAFDAEFWGVVDSVSVSFTYSKVSQSITVERVNHE